MSFNIAIDGPAGAGKSTIAKLVAQKLRYIYVDTGAMYRALAYYFLKNNFDYSDEKIVENEIKHAIINIQYNENVQQVILNEENITAFLRTEEVGNVASKTSAYKCVREHLLKLQQTLAETNNVIMDGRDIGTCVLPNAQVKIFLTASVETRALRRFKELEEKGQTADLEQIKSDIKERDERDSTRAISPLKQAEDAVLIDSSSMSIDEVVNEIIKIVEAVQVQ